MIGDNNFLAEKFEDLESYVYGELGSMEEEIKEADDRRIEAEDKLLCIQQSVALIVDEYENGNIQCDEKVAELFEELKELNELANETESTDR